MPKEKIRNEQVSRIETQTLQADEIQQLKNRLYKQVLLYLPAYILLLTGLLIIFLNAPASILHLRKMVKGLIFKN